MSTRYIIQSSDTLLLEKATQTAKAFAEKLAKENVVGIVLLGAVARGYFDRSADIDIGIFKKQSAEIPLREKFYQVDGFEVQVWLSDYESEIIREWDMAKRWTYSDGKIFFDPQGKIAGLLKEKVPLRPEEKRWLMMRGFTLSEWYIKRLTQVWVERGNMVSAHHMIEQGLNYFFEMLFGLNHALVPDAKWRYFCLEQLERLPNLFGEHIKDVMRLGSFTLEELERRKAAFMGMWEEMTPVVEGEVGMTFEEMLEVV